LGGTKLDNDWHPNPQPEITKDIIARCLELCPEIAPPAARDNGRAPTVDEVVPIVVESGCGLRPARKSGLRIERDILEIEGTGLKSRKIPVVYNYG
jgi:D-amino-acid oxidase